MSNEFPHDDGLPWGFIEDGMWLQLPKQPMLLASLGPPPFKVTLPHTGEVREIVHKPEESTMTTTVKVHVNGKYRATVKQDGRDPVTIEGNYNGGSGEKQFTLPHPATATFEIAEVQVAEGDERPA